MPDQVLIQLMKIAKKERGHHAIKDYKVASSITLKIKLATSMPLHTFCKPVKHSFEYYYNQSESCPVIKYSCYTKITLALQVSKKKIIGIIANVTFPGTKFVVTKITSFESIKCEY